MLAVQYQKKANQRFWYKKQKFWYDFLKKVCEGNKLIYMDTDGFIFEVAKSFNEIMLEHKEYFDLSNFPNDSKYYDSTNKKYQAK